MSAPSITVWIQTCNRPQFLRTALESVRRQTAREEIAEVIVVENGNDRRSEGVCGEFKELPVRYVFREPPLAPGSIENVEALEAMLTQCESEWLAVLFDDDWWTPNHLERALEGLSAEPTAVASFCLYLNTGGESHFVSHVSESFVLWLGTRGRPRGERWVLEPADLVMSSLLASTLHFSAMVVDRRVFIDALEALKTGNPYDSDRVLGVELGYHGKVLCDSVPTVFVRWHEGNECARLQKSGEGLEWWNRSTDQILAKAKAHGMDVRHELVESMRCTGATIYDMMRHAHPGAVDYLVANHFLTHHPLKSRSNINLRSLTPPFVWNALRSLRRRVAGK